MLPNIINYHCSDDKSNSSRGHEDSIPLRLKECVIAKGHTAEHIPVASNTLLD